MKVFEDYFSELQGDMVSICLEYVNGKAEEIYIYCSYEPETYYFNVFYKVNGSIVHKHMLNEFSAGYVYDTSIERQKTLMKIGMSTLNQTILLKAIFYKQPDLGSLMYCANGYYYTN